MIGASLSVYHIDDPWSLPNIANIGSERAEVRMRRSQNWVPSSLCAAGVLAFTLLAASIPSSMAQDAQAGATVFNRCSACHQVGPGASNALGPHLNGLMGRPVASVPGYDYSDALRARNGQAWNPQLVSDYIADPARFIGARSSMPAQRLRPDQVANLMAYLESQ